MKRPLILLALLFSALVCHAQYHIESPDMQLRVSLQSNRKRKGISKITRPDRMFMQVSVLGNRLLNSEVELVVKSKGRRYSFGKGNVVHAIRQQRMVDAPDARDSMLTLMKGRYNSLTIVTDNHIVLEVRAYNNGVAYRFKVNHYEGDYKILNLSDLFPEESSVAILGTFEGDYTSPWSALHIGLPPASVASWPHKRPKPKIAVHSMRNHLGIRRVPWRDALSSLSVGTAVNWHTGNTWGDFTNYHTLNVDLTYKHLFTGIGVTTCQQMQYILLGESFWPFEGVVKDIYLWSIGARAGYCLPVQNGYEVWSFIPYVATTLMHLHQHGKLRPGANALSHHGHWLVGPGVKVQVSDRYGFTLGVGYEYQFFTDRLAPDGMHAVSVSVGKTF